MYDTSLDLLPLETLYDANITWKADHEPRCLTGYVVLASSRFVINLRQSPAISKPVIMYPLFGVNLFVLL